MKFRSKDGRIYNNRVRMLLANIKSKVSSRKSDKDEFLDFEEFDDDLFDEDDDDSDRSIDNHVVEMSKDKIDEMKLQALNIAEAKWGHHIKLLCIPEPKVDDNSEEAMKLRQLHYDFYSAAAIKDHDTAQKELDKILVQLKKDHPEWIVYEDIPKESDISPEDTITMYEMAQKIFAKDNPSAKPKGLFVHGDSIYDTEACDKAINDQLNAAANAGIINPPDGSSATVTLEDGRKIELRNLQTVDDSTDILDEPIEDDPPIRVTEHPVEGMVDVSIFRGYSNEDDPEIMYKLKRDTERERSMSEEETNDSDEGEQL